MDQIAFTILQNRVPKVQSKQQNDSTSKSRLLFEQKLNPNSDITKITPISVSQTRIVKDLSSFKLPCNFVVSGPILKCKVFSEITD